MKIALCSSFVPFIFGGARNIVEWLEIHLRDAGHQVERIYLPQVDAPDLLMQQMAAYRWVDLTSTVDRIICFRPPAHLIPHPDKIVWFIHHFRVFYDLWDTPYRHFPDDEGHRGLRRAIHAIDTAALGEAKKVFANSRVVADRLRRFNGIASEVLYPPLFNPERFSCRSFSDEILYISRLEHHKRQHLAIEALKHTRTPVKLRLSGTAADTQYAESLRKMVREFGLQNRVLLEDRWIDEDEKVRQLGDCLAAMYLPLDEDSYGYPTLEASHSQKAILTTSDSGGVLELVEDGVNGLVVLPDPQCLAAAMDRLFLDRNAARRMGLLAGERVKELTVGWPHVIEKLLS